MTESPGGGTHEVGSLAEEAARLAEALQAWSGRDGLGGVLADHLATGSRECTLCPVCRLIALARTAGPEVYDHLADAAAALARAVRTLADHQQAARDGGSRVEHIDLDDEGEDKAWD